MRKPRKEKQSVFVGDKVTTTRCGTATLIEYTNSKNCVAGFDDGVVVKTSARQFRIGEVSNPYHPTTCGVGYLGETKLITDWATRRRAILLWCGMLARCYRDQESRNRHYVDCTVDECWHNFSNFLSWYVDNQQWHIEDWQLDKDVLFKGNTIYGPNTCCFLPKDINTFTILRERGRGAMPLGVTRHQGKYVAQISTLGKQRWLGSFATVEEAFSTYKIEKEAEARRLAEKYVDKIREDAYNTLIKYEVNFTD